LGLNWKKKKFDTCTSFFTFEKVVDKWKYSITVWSTVQPQ